MTGLKERREALDIHADVAKHVAAEVRRVLDENEVVVHYIEHPGVDDGREIASPIDIVGTVKGHPAVIDVKSAKDYKKISYCVQMVAYTSSVRYVDGERLPWFPGDDRPLQAWLLHIPLTPMMAAHAAGKPMPSCDLIWVDVEAARPWADMLHTLRRIRPAVAFPGKAEAIPVDAAGIACDATDTKIAAPDERTANAPPVEQPAGEAAPSPASPATYDLDRFGRPVLPPAEEGDDADPAAIAVLKARYAALEGDGRLWVNSVAKQAQAAGGALSLADSQPQSIRRFEAMRALVLLAEGGFADDNATRGILRPILGDVADMPIFTLGKLVAALPAHEAARFAQLADTVANGTVALSVKLDGRYEWEFTA